MHESFGSERASPSPVTAQQEKEQQSIKTCEELASLSCEIEPEAERDARILARVSKLAPNIANPKKALMALKNVELAMQLENPEADILSDDQAIKTLLVEQGFLAEDRKKLSNYETFLQSHQGKTNLEIARLATTSDQVPEAEKAKLAAFLKIMDLAATKEDQAYLSQTVNRLDVASLPSPDVFIQSEIFDNPNVSEQTQTAIAKAFNLTPKRVVTGSDIQKNANLMVPDPETGEPTPAYTRAQPLQYRDGMSAFTDEHGNLTIQARTVSGQMREIPVAHWSGESLGTISELMHVQLVAEEAGLAPIANAILGSAYLDRLDASDLDRRRQILDALLGGNTGYDGAVFGNGETSFLRAQLQLLAPPSGNADDTTSHLQSLGVLDEQGTLNLAVLLAVGSYGQEQYKSGVPTLGGLREYLADTFPNLSGTNLPTE